MYEFFKKFGNSVASFVCRIFGYHLQMEGVPIEVESFHKGSFTPTIQTSLPIGKLIVHGRLKGGNHRLVAQTKSGVETFKIFGRPKNGVARIRRFGDGNAPVILCEFKLAA